MSTGNLRKKIDYDSYDSESSGSAYVAKRQQKSDTEGEGATETFFDQMTAILGNDSNTPSQDSFEMYDSLQSIIPKFNSASATHYLQS